jgi:hypothetical protein
MTKQRSLLFQGAGGIEKDAAAREQLVAFARQEKPPPDAIEEAQAELVLEIDDLPRQGRLSGPQAQGRLGDGAELGHGHEGPGVSQVHAGL